MVGINYRGVLADSTNQSSYTFSSVNIDVASTNRLVAVVLHGRGITGSSISGITIGGVAAKNNRSISNTGSGATSSCSIFTAVVPTGTTADIVVTYEQEQLRCICHTYVLSGARADTIFTKGSDSTDPTFANGAIKGSAIILGTNNAVSSGTAGFTNLTANDAGTSEEALTGAAASGVVGASTDDYSFGATTIAGANIPCTAFILVRSSEEPSYKDIIDSEVYSASFDGTNTFTASGTPPSVQYTSGGPFGQQMFDFNGQTKLLLPNASSGGYSFVSLWFKPDTISSARMILDTGDRFNLQCRDNGKLRLRIYNGSAFVEAITGAIISAGELRHIMFGLDQDGMKIYVDGQLEGFNPIDTFHWGATAQYLGARVNNGLFVDGGIADWRYFSRQSMSRVDAQTLMDGGRPKNLADPTLSLSGDNLIVTNPDSNWYNEDNGTLTFTYTWQKLIAETWTTFTPSISQTEHAPSSSGEFRVLVSASNDSGSDPLQDVITNVYEIVAAPSYQGDEITLDLDGVVNLDTANWDAGGELPTSFDVAIYKDNNLQDIIEEYTNEKVFAYGSGAYYAIVQAYLGSDTDPENNIATNEIHWNDKTKEAFIPVTDQVLFKRAVKNTNRMHVFSPPRTASKAVSNSPTVASGGQYADKYLTTKSKRIRDQEQ